jgi:hypothetical protein
MDDIDDDNLYKEASSVVDSSVFASEGAVCGLAVETSSDITNVLESVEVEDVCFLDIPPPQIPHFLLEPAPVITSSVEYDTVYFPPDGGTVGEVSEVEVVEMGVQTSPDPSPPVVPLLESRVESNRERVEMGTQTCDEFRGDVDVEEQPCGVTESNEDETEVTSLQVCEQGPKTSLQVCSESQEPRSSLQVCSEPQEPIPADLGGPYEEPCEPNLADSKNEDPGTVCASPCPELRDDELEEVDQLVDESPVREQPDICTDPVNVASEFEVEDPSLPPCELQTANEPPPSPVQLSQEVVDPVIIEITSETQDELVSDVVEVHQTVIVESEADVTSDNADVRELVGSETEIALTSEPTGKENRSVTVPSPFLEQLGSTEGLSGELSHEEVDLDGSEPAKPNSTEAFDDLVTTETPENVQSITVSHGLVTRDEVGERVGVTHACEMEYDVQDGFSSELFPDGTEFPESGNVDGSHARSSQENQLSDITEETSERCGDGIGSDAEETKRRIFVDPDLFTMSSSDVESNADTILETGSTFSGDDMSAGSSPVPPGHELDIDSLYTSELFVTLKEHVPTENERVIRAEELVISGSSAFGDDCGPANFVIDSVSSVPTALMTQVFLDPESIVELEEDRPPSVI